jgi:hypothetical protein
LSASLGWHMAGVHIAPPTRVVVDGRWTDQRVVVRDTPSGQSRGSSLADYYPFVGTTRHADNPTGLALDGGCRGVAGRSIGRCWRAHCDLDAQVVDGWWTDQRVVMRDTPSGQSRGRSLTDYYPFVGMASLADKPG